MLINILGKGYQISFQKASNDTMLINSFGYSQYELQNIVINADYGPEQQSESVLHEIIHCISEEGKLKLNESQVRMLSILLFQVLKSNTDLPF